MIEDLEAAVSPTGATAFPPDLSSKGHLLGRDPVALYMDQLASDSRETTRRSLRRLARLHEYPSPDQVPWERLRQPDVARIRSMLEASTTARGTRISPATANAAMAALRGVLRAARDLGYMTADEYTGIAGVRLVRGSRLLAGRAARPGELGALLEACYRDPTPAGARDAAIIALVYGTGMRRAELAALELEHYNPEASELRVIGKGNKERLAFVSGGTAAALADWIAVRGDHPGRLFDPINKGGRIGTPRPEGGILGGGMTAKSIYQVLSKRAAQAGLSEPLTPHDLRRSFAGDLLDTQQADLSTVQQLMGHASPQTTARYDRRPDAARRRAAELLHVPYRRRGGR